MAAQLEKDADALGLSLTGEEWEGRLLIKAKGGGTHFDEPMRAEAGHAYRRGAAMLEAAGWHAQLRDKAAQLARAAAQSAKGEGVGKGALLERARDLVRAARRTVGEICDEQQLRRLEPEMGRLKVPQELRAEAAAVSAAAAPLGAWAHALCLAEQRSLQKEATMTQRFRAPGTLAVLRGGEQLLLEMQPFVPAARCDVPRLLGELRSAAAEVEPLCGAQTAGFEELDDEI